MTYRYRYHCKCHYKCHNINFHRCQCNDLYTQTYRYSLCKMQDSLRWQYKDMCNHPHKFDHKYYCNQKYKNLHKQNGIVFGSCHYIALHSHHTYYMKSMCWQ